MYRVELTDIRTLNWNFLKGFIQVHVDFLLTLALSLSSSLLVRFPVRPSTSKPDINVSPHSDRDVSTVLKLVDTYFKSSCLLFHTDKSANTIAEPRFSLKPTVTNVQLLKRPRKR